jgi:hypothetical protein
MRIPKALNRKWWFRSIRERNYFGYRYWWFNYFLLLLVTVLFLWMMRSLQPIAENCDEERRIDEVMLSINAHLYDCCNCFELPSVDSVSNSIPDSVMSPCNEKQASGGEGITENNIMLGTASGIVDILFDTENIPDKIDVFYEGKLIASTRQISGSRGGFVGGIWGNGTGSLSFNYQFNKNDYVTVRVIGGDQSLDPSMSVSGSTAWNYIIQCPH